MKNDLNKLAELSNLKNVMRNLSDTDKLFKRV